MATTLATLVDRTRRFMRDDPDLDQLTASCTSAASTLTVADTTKYAIGERIEVDYETIIVRALTNATTLTVTRGTRGSTASTHVNSSSVLKSPSFTFSDYVDALNMAIDATFPLLYKEVVDETLTTSSGTYEYTIPSLDGTAIPYISEVKYKYAADFKYYPRSDWRVMRGSTPKLAFAFDMSPATLRIRGFGRFPHLVASTDALDTQFPGRAENLLTMYAANWLLMSGESARVRYDSMAVDAREQATRPGSSMQAATGMLQRFQMELAHLAMPPLPRHITPTFPSF